MKTDKLFASALIFAVLGCCAISCGPVYRGLEGMSRLQPEDTTVKCPYCGKHISQDDRRCPFCGRDVQFDLGSGVLDKESRELGDQMVRQRNR